MNVFSERQQFRQWWLWLIILGVGISPVIITLNDSKLGYKGHTTSDIMLGALIPAIIIVLFLIMQLRTRIDATGIYYRFFPIHFQVLCIDWADVEKAYVRKYSPLLDYGGWGIRLGLGGKGKAYNVSGNMGLQIELKTGKKILIGSNKTEELQAVLEQLVKEKVIARKTITV